MLQLFSISKILLRTSFLVQLVLLHTWTELCLVTFCMLVAPWGSIHFAAWWLYRCLLLPEISRHLRFLKTSRIALLLVALFTLPKLVPWKGVGAGELGWAATRSPGGAGGRGERWSPVWWSQARQGEMRRSKAMWPGKIREVLHWVKCNGVKYWCVIKCDEAIMAGNGVRAECDISNGYVRWGGYQYSKANA